MSDFSLYRSQWEPDTILAQYRVFEDHIVRTGDAAAGQYLAQRAMLYLSTLCDHQETSFDKWSESQRETIKEFLHTIGVLFCVMEQALMDLPFKVKFRGREHIIVIENISRQSDGTYCIEGFDEGNKYRAIMGVTEQSLLDRVHVIE